MESFVYFKLTFVFYLSFSPKINNPRWNNPFSPLSCCISGDLQCLFEEALAGCAVQWLPERRGSLLPSTLTPCVVLLTLWDWTFVLSCCSSCCALCFSAHCLSPPPVAGASPPFTCALDRDCSLAWPGNSVFPHSSTSLIFRSPSLPNACFLRKKSWEKV